MGGDQDLEDGLAGQLLTAATSLGDIQTLIGTEPRNVLECIDSAILDGLGQKRAQGSTKVQKHVDASRDQDLVPSDQLLR